jgi:hypothetical protein
MMSCSLAEFHLPHTNNLQWECTWNLLFFFAFKNFKTTIIPAT